MQSVLILVPLAMMVISSLIADMHPSDRVHATEDDLHLQDRSAAVKTTFKKPALV